MTVKEYYETLGISPEVYDFASEIEKDLKDRFEEFDRVAEMNQMKVLWAMQKNKLSEVHFNATTGYGYNDLGREALEQIYADVFKTEDALVVKTQ